MEEYSIILFMLLCICCEKMNLRQNNFILECGSINLYFSLSQIILTNSEQRYNQFHLRSGDHVSRIFFFFKCLLITFYWSHITFCPHQSHTSTLFHSPSSVKMSKNHHGYYTQPAWQVFEGEARLPRWPLHFT